MPTISTTHDTVLLNGQSPLADEALSQFTPYCYLLPELANDDSTSLIHGHDAFQTRNKLAEFAALMSKSNDRQKSKLPAVYTYFGQFLNHDISAPTGSMAPAPVRGPDGDIINIGADLTGLDKTGRPATIAPIIARIRNQHSSPLSLNSLYGSGPFGGDPGSLELYKPGEPVFDLGTTFDIMDATVKEIGKITRNPTSIVPDTRHLWDLKRKPGKSIIADQRNDENLIISQLHLAFMLFHNNAVKALRPNFTCSKKLFDAARQIVTWHYHWCIIHDYLDRLQFQNSVAKALAGPNLITYPNQVPMEFTSAAFRFGHSMVSDKYNYNQNFTDGGKLGGPATLEQLFEFTSRGKMGGFSKNLNNQLPNHWVSDWSMLTSADGQEHSGSDPIDTMVSGSMINMASPVIPFGNIEHASIVSRNILRGFHRRIPCGQSIAQALGFPALAPEKIAQLLPVDAASFAVANGLTKQTPAWVYFLCEAEADPDAGGKKLGPVASHVVAATIIGLLKHNQDSVLNAQGGQWTPEISPLQTPKGKQPINDIKSFLQFAGVLDEH